MDRSFYSFAYAYQLGIIYMSAVTVVGTGQEGLLD